MPGLSQPPVDEVSRDVRHIVILGLMGAGKTTVGRVLARRLGWRYRDNDAALTFETGSSAREINARLGSHALHRLEAEDLLAALSDPERAVVGAAASTIENEDCRAALARPSTFGVWLRVDPAVLGLRARTGRHRPELATDLEAFLARQHAVRAPLFESVARLIVDGSAPPNEIASTIVAALPR